ncbi:AAA family ATPase [Paraburkholderia bonniea]|uniref:AAA family ATPase n=1 Tax=Paraburkholderia bonniea TaxID=2152891 RepID=UPI001290E197
MSPIELSAVHDTGQAGMSREPLDPGVALAHGFARRIGTLAQHAGAAAASIQWAARAAYAISRATAEGHVCLPVQALAEHYSEPLETVLAALCASGIACDGTADSAGLNPLVIDRQKRLYLARYYDYERRFARALVEHTQHPAMAGVRAAAQTDDALASPASTDALRAKLIRFFGVAADDTPDWQRLAAVIALSGPLTVVSGGPGTGKTTTVVGVLACLLDTHADLRIALSAPTGKAAQRMQEALAARAGALPEELAARLPRTSWTLHRLLGYRPDGRFRYRKDNPLPYDVIVVDEASMIDVAMAAHLLDALAPGTRLVLLGDKDQLAAVEAGAVFAELSARPVFSAQGIARLAVALDIEPQRIVASLPQERSPEDGDEGLADRRAWSWPQAGADADLFWPDHAEQAFAAMGELVEPPRVATASGGRVAVGEADDGNGNTPQAQLQPVEAPLADCVVWLERNYRFGLESPIGRLSLAIRCGAVDQVLALLQLDSDDPAKPDAAAFYEDAGATLAPSTVARLTSGFTLYAEALMRELASSTPDPQPLFDALNHFRILCATRAGPRGVDQINLLMTAQLQRLARAPLAPGASWFAGRPVIVTRNDAALGLFNGDTGIALPGADGALKVYFCTGDSGLRGLSPAALPSHDTAFALTVHKSQGSEFEHVALMLPAVFNRVLSRELIYTAVTRARQRIDLTGTRTVLAQAVATPTRRDSGLAERIMEALP